MKNLWDIVDRQDLSGIPVLETRPTVGLKFEYRLIRVFFETKENGKSNERKREKKKQLKGLYVQGVS